MPVPSRSWTIVPSWDGKLHSRYPRGFLEGTHLTIEQIKRPEIWNLVWPVLQRARAEGWTQKDAQQELLYLLYLARSWEAPPVAVESEPPYKAQVVRIIREQGPGVAIAIFVAVADALLQNDAATYNTDYSDHRVQIDNQHIEIVINEFAMKDPAEQERWCREFVAEAERAKREDQSAEVPDKSGPP